MKEYNKNKMRKTTVITTIVFLLLLVVVAILIMPNGSAPNIIGTNHRNVTVWTHANVTNSKPEVMNVTVYAMNNASMRNITIVAGSTRTVYCNATVRDWNGFNDITYVNGTLWHVPTSDYDLADDNNSHYTNVSCTLNDSISTYIGWYVCAFDVYYYANNGTWNCNVSIQDTENKTGWRHNSTVMLPVYALNVTDGIDYGNVAVEDYTAPDVSANVTNLGNMAINVSVQGYGTRLRDGLAMNCSLSGNITVDNERFALTPGIAWAAKTPLTSLTATNTGLNIQKQTVPNVYVTNSTYWQLYVPPNPAGNCTGYIVFMAQAP